MREERQWQKVKGNEKDTGEGKRKKKMLEKKSQGQDLSITSHVEMPEDSFSWKLNGRYLSQTFSKTLSNLK